MIRGYNSTDNDVMQVEIVMGKEGPAGQRHSHVHCEGNGLTWTDSDYQCEQFGSGLFRSGILDLNDPKFCILHWLTVLLENREFDH